MSMGFAQEDFSQNNFAPVLTFSKYLRVAIPNFLLGILRVAFPTHLKGINLGKMWMYQIVP